MKKLFLLTAFFLTSLAIKSQRRDQQYYLIDSIDLSSLNKNDKAELDSLLKSYHATASDSAKIRALKALGNLNDFNTSWAYTRKLMLETQKLLSKGANDVSKAQLYRRYGHALYNMHYYFSMANQEDSSLRYLKLCIEPFRLAGDQQGLASAYQGLGVNASRTGKTQEGLSFFHKALEIHEKLNNKSDIASLYVNMAVEYREINELDKALKYALDALKINENEKLEDHLPDNWNQIGIIYKYRGDTSAAKKAYQNSLDISMKTGNRYGVAVANLNLGVIEQEHKEYQLALRRYLQSLEDFKSVQSTNGEAHTLNSIGIVYQLMGEYDKALEYVKKAHEMNLQMQYPESIMNSSQSLGVIYEKLGRYMEAMQFQKQYFHLKDSLENADAQKAILRKQLEYENEKRVTDLKKEQHEEMLIAEQEKKRQRLIIVFTVAGLITVGFFLAFLFNRFRLIKKQKKIIEEKSHLLLEKNKEVYDSIAYAKRLQEAILPSLHDIRKNMPGAFVFYQPKDIVAGDFYWMHPLSTNKILFAVADSTGHGVPGALVSVVCSNALNRCVNEYIINDPGKILDKTRELVSETFRKNNKEVKDGMDISLALFEFNNNGSVAVRWAGANNPLWYFKGNEFFEIKADKQPVGLVDNPKPFTTHEISLTKGDTLYLFTDGYADQFGGQGGKKLKYKPFANILDQCRKLDAESQELFLKDRLAEWKGNLEQVDDICVAGIIF